MKGKIIIICGGLLLITSFLFMSCMVEKPNPCDCAQNDSYQTSSNWNEALAKKCDRYANSLNSNDLKEWNMEKQACMGTGK